MTSYTKRPEKRQITCDNCGKQDPKAKPHVFVSPNHVVVLGTGTYTTGSPDWNVASLKNDWRFLQRHSTESRIYRPARLYCGHQCMAAGEVCAEMDREDEDKPLFKVTFVSAIDYENPVFTFKWLED